MNAGNVDVDVTLSTTSQNIKGEKALNTVVNRNRKFINKLEELVDPSCSLISSAPNPITLLCEKVSSTFYDLYFNISRKSIKILAEVFYNINYVNINYSVTVKNSTVFLQDFFFRLKLYKKCQYS